MQLIKCPHCGAPPPATFVPPPGQFSYNCPYCRQHSLLGSAPVPTPPPAHAPAIIVVHAPSHDYEDHSHHHHAAVAHVNAARNLSWIIWLVVVLVVSLGGSGAAFMRCSKHSSLISSLVWDGSEPLQCSGNEDIAVTGVEATFTGGTAIVATGNCHFRCTDCKVSAPIAIEASGNAQVTFVNGSVQGTSVLADASGNARVNISGNVTSSGRVREMGAAKVSAPPPPPVATTPPAPTPPPVVKPVAASATTPTAKPKTK